MPGPGSGRYTTYASSNSAKKTFLARSFSNDANPFADKPSDQIREEIVKNGNEFLRASNNRGGKRGDPDMFPQGVYMNYSGQNLPFTPPGGQNPDDLFTPQASGDPMNAFVPDVSSPGTGARGVNATELGEVRVEGTDKLLENNPGLKPSQVKPGYDTTVNTRQPKDSTVYKNNMLGESNINLVNIEQYPE
jgi:hypothetical protein